MTLSVPNWLARGGAPADFASLCSQLPESALLLWEYGP